MKILVIASLLAITPALAGDHGQPHEAPAHQPHAPAHHGPEKAVHHEGKPVEEPSHHSAPALVLKPKAVTHWSYRGSDGPAHWASLDTEFAVCVEGKEQSPIDLKWSKQKGKRKISFHYSEGLLHIVDNGHTIQVDVPVGSYAQIDGRRFSLVQFHFHAESEHTFSGRHYPLEAHFLHKDAEGKLAVVGVMFETLALKQSF
jgi:carbonic anhydrase